VIVSAFADFCTFLSFRGFGYFDPFHAFVTAILIVAGLVITNVGMTSVFVHED
jgi:hypothetical protein